METRFWSYFKEIEPQLATALELSHHIGGMASLCNEEQVLGYNLTGDVSAVHSLDGSDQSWFTFGEWDILNDPLAAKSNNREVFAGSQEALQMYKQIHTCDMFHYRCLMAWNVAYTAQDISDPIFRIAHQEVSVLHDYWGYYIHRQMEGNAKHQADEDHTRFGDLVDHWIDYFPVKYTPSEFEHKGVRLAEEDEVRGIGILYVLSLVSYRGKEISLLGLG